jgi:hypothetical protein
LHRLLCAFNPHIYVGVCASATKVIAVFLMMQRKKRIFGKYSSVSPL